MTRSAMGLRLWLALGFALGGACAPSALAAQGAVKAFGNPAVWRWAPSRTYHVANYRLALRFDEARGEVFGDEVVTLRPLNAGFERFYLNSTGLAIDSVQMAPADGAHTPLRFTVAATRLWITLDRRYDAGTMLRVRIVYHGTPRTGLFFVHPSANEPDAPHEVFSQGEPEFNEYWFPCWDYPNDLATSETITTVPDGQRVVSNGRLVHVTHQGGMATFDWVERVPHSSYLVSIAAGPWREVTDHAGATPVDYYVPTSVNEETTRRSFHLTPDMIQFFASATGVPYPYEQYAQTTVHDFVFGGQENVSATTLTDKTLHDARADADYPSTGLVAHELGQHWFGDYVQGEDWADIWLNEGFATYMEALYTQHHAGTDAFRYEMSQDQAAARAQDQHDYLRPIVSRHYADPLDMFDAITHEKGAAVLDMLRYVVDGPQAASHPARQQETLFRALHAYLTEHRERAVVTPDLIESIRESTGLELGWFFREWVFMAGTPDYHVSANYDSARGVEAVRVSQAQRVDSMTPVFTMPLELSFHGANGDVKDVQVGDSLRDQVFVVPLEFSPQWVDFDPDDFIDKTVAFPQPMRALVAKAERDPAMMSRLSAVDDLGAAGSDADSTVTAALVRVLNSDGFGGVRAAAAGALGKIGSAQARVALRRALRHQPDNSVRAAAATALGAAAQAGQDSAGFHALVDALERDSSYAVHAAAARAIGRSGNARAFEVLRGTVAADANGSVQTAALDALAATKDPRTAAILLDQVRPGAPESIRAAALEDLARLKGAVQQSHAAELSAAVQLALADPFLPVRMAAEDVVGAFGLTQFRAEVARDADAPLDFQRALANGVLTKLDQATHESGPPRP